jgi:hypothetical protein
MRTALLFSFSLFAACGGDDVQTCSDSNCEQEVITTVILTLTPTGGAAIVAEVDDPDGDGGNPPTVDSISLADGMTYAVTVGFENRLETPPEVITDEVRDEAVDHQIFFTGTAVNGPASDHSNAPISQSYTDTDDNGLPIGLSNSFVVVAAPAGDLIVTLRHMPPLNGHAVKTADAAMAVKTMGFSAIGGEIDAQVTFPVAISVP